MKTRFNVVKSGWVKEDQITYEQKEIPEEVLEIYQTEKQAIEHLLTLDTDTHYIEKENEIFIDGWYSDWERDENYGRCGGFKYIDELV